MKKILFLLILINSTIYCQKNKSSKMGQTTIDELKMNLYEKDSTASAVVLYEHANIYLDPDNNYDTRTDYYFRIKILNKRSFNLANISIDIFKKNKAINIKATTYNLSENETIIKNKLSKKNIYTTVENDTWSSKKFTLPNIKVGSVLEYSYSILTPYLGIDDWKFQSDIPKIKSEFDAAILGNYKYNVRIIGFLKLDKDNPSIKKNCIQINGAQGGCVIYSFGMNNIPAFKEEDFMLSKKNYVSRLTFDLKSSTDPRGRITNYTKSWKDADKKLKSIFFNNQTSKKSFFKSKLPDSIIKNKDDLQKAKNIYNFIKNHFTWNERYWNSNDVKVKKAFNNKIGSAGEINLALYNSLKAADLNVDLVILSTRNHGLPTKLIPVIFDFNYVIVLFNDKDKKYFLDATNKYLPFGQLPLRTLNGQARVMDFSKESNWVTLKNDVKTSKTIRANLVLSQEGIFSGYIKIKREGFEALNTREKINSISENSYLEEYEDKNSNLEIVDYNVLNRNIIDKPLHEKFKINLISNNELSNKFRINPFFIDRYNVNPFKLDERNYPVDFGYSRRNAFYLSIKIPENYKITQTPKNIAISLPNNGGIFTYKTTQKGNTVNFYVRFNTLKKIYPSDEYFALKEFFNQIIKAEKSYIIIEKV